VQPVLFAVMVSLAGLWRAFGVEPDAVVGHSQGEIAAACVAGGLSLSDAARVVAVRSRALAGLAGGGGMVSVALDVGGVERLIEGWSGSIALAAVNGPVSSVVSGDGGALEELLVECEAQGIRARRIAVDYAAHSAQVEAVRDELLAGCEGISPRSGAIPFYSTQAGGLLDTGELGGEYWYRNLRDTVRFEQVTRALVERGVAGAFIEVSPHPVLTVGMQETIDLLHEQRAGGARDGSRGAGSGGDGRGAAAGGGRAGDVEAAAAGAGAGAAAGGGGGGVVVIGSLRRGVGGPERMVGALAEAWVCGAEVDWGVLFEGAGARPVELPTYAFQRERYWAASSRAGLGDPVAAGLDVAEHPLLGAALALAGDGGWLFTGSLSLQELPWLEDHRVSDVVLVPGTALLELALHAGSRVGCELVQELVLQAPLTLTQAGARQIQLVLQRPDEEGCRAFALHSRRQAGSTGGSEEPWRSNATGVLAPAGRRDGAGGESALVGQVWPPAGAVAIDIEGLYGRLAEQGLEYGPAFQGLQAGWRRGAELFGEVVLGAQEREVKAQRYELHPALLDAALHLIGAALPAGEQDERDIGPRLPFAWSDVCLHRPGASRLRVRLAPTSEGAFELQAVDERGALLATARSLSLRAVSSEQLNSERVPADSLFTVCWQALQAQPDSPGAGGSWALLGDAAELHEALASEMVQIQAYPDLPALRAALADGAPAPQVVLARPARPQTDDQAAAAHQIASETLTLAQEWVAEQTLDDAQLVLLTENAVPTSPQEDPANLYQAPAWGLLRSAQTENPGRFVLVDLDNQTSSYQQIPTALATNEPQLAIRAGRLSIPRLTPTTTTTTNTAAQPIQPHHTVLITGGTGLLGATIARHLVTHHQARRLLLISRRGPDAPGASELANELQAHDATVQIARCDVTDRDALANLINTIPNENPLHTIIHAAGALNDKVLDSLTQTDLHQVLAPKITGAWHLHQLTTNHPITTFTLFSAAASTLGAAAQANYAAANTFLDTLAAHRHAHDLPAQTLAWGLWQQASEMTGGLTQTHRERIAGAGVIALGEQEGLALFDAASRLADALVLPIRLDMTALRSRGDTDGLPSLLYGLAATPARRIAQTASLQARLADVPPAERERLLIELTLSQIAAVLHHPSTDGLEPAQPFKELGFDSLAAIELRNRLAAETGLRLPATLIFDHPTPTAVARRLLEGLDRRAAPDAVSIDVEIAELEHRLSALASRDDGRTAVAARLRSFLVGLDGGAGIAQEDDDAEDVRAASAEEVLELIDRELGSPEDGVRD
jgi:pimaricinolide synthase PimS1